MKTKFCLRTKESLTSMPFYPFVIILVVALAFFIYIRDWLFFFVIQLPTIIMVFGGIYVGQKTKKERFYIDGKEIYTIGWFANHIIDPKRIKGIKIMHMYTAIDNWHIPWNYKEGRPIFLMILLSEITPKMYNYKGNEYQFGFFLGKYIIAKVEYDPEAVKYLKTLNPDIKVFY